MSENVNEAAAPAAATHRGSAEGTARVLGQTAAVAGISGALLLALKALVLVSPAVLPDQSELDALGRANPIVDSSDDTAPPVIFTPVASPVSNEPVKVGSSERTARQNPANPAPVASGPSKQVAGEVKDKPANKPEKPSNNDDGRDDENRGSGGVVKDLTDTVSEVGEGLLGEDNAVSGLLDGAGTTLDNVTKSLGADKLLGGGAEKPADGATEAPTVGGGDGGVVDTVVGTVNNLTSGLGLTSKDADGEGGDGGLGLGLF